MACEQPKWIYKKGEYKELTWKQVYTGNDSYEVGCWANCGHCTSCNNLRSNDWLVRNWFEEKNHEKKSFITLTYEHSPLILLKKDLQDFVKRLRTNLDRTTGEKIRIYTVGEYGSADKTKRPHYHLIIYGWQDDKAKYLGINKKGNIYYKSDLIRETWNKGRISYQKFATNEIAYMSLHNTPKEIYKAQYLLNKESLNKLERYAYGKVMVDQHGNFNKNLVKEIIELRKKVEESKNDYVAVKEFNTYSQALGWENFFNEYSKSKNYAFEHYITNGGNKVGTFPTPNSWLRKLATKYGDVAAMEELLKREEMIETEKNKNLYLSKIKTDLAAKKKMNILELRDPKKTKITEL